MGLGERQPPPDATFDSRASWRVDGATVPGHVKVSSADRGGAVEEKWLVKELLLLQRHVAPQPSGPVRDYTSRRQFITWSARLFLAQWLGLMWPYRSDSVPCIVWLSIGSSHRFITDVSELFWKWNWDFLMVVCVNVFLLSTFLSFFLGVLEAKQVPLRTWNALEMITDNIKK